MKKVGESATHRQKPVLLPILAHLLLRDRRRLGRVLRGRGEARAVVLRGDWGGRLAVGHREGWRSVSGFKGGGGKERGKWGRREGAGR